jgi:hypothetical protein
VNVIRWWEAHPLRWAAENQAMGTAAPALVWTEELTRTTGGGWSGIPPIWPFTRTQPPGLLNFVGDAVFRIEVRCSPAHPAIAPSVFPLEPEPDLRVRTQQQWHLLGNGGLCLLQNTLDWTGREFAAELVTKAAGWFLEYLLLERGLIVAMTESGIVESDEFDSFFGEHPDDQ